MSNTIAWLHLVCSECWKIAESSGLDLTEGRKKQ